MADLSTPRSWKAEAAPAADHTSVKEKASRDVFLWPTPPYASYPPATEQTETLPCQLLTGAELKVVSG
ncbi:MAG: hypothetical protein ABI364_04220, partial [Caldimonas sp.]